MIYCPKCGTANRDMSRFCNECGHELGRATAITCLQCGQHNPVQSIFCQQCGQRLEGAMPLSEPQPDVPPIKGLSLPVKGQGGDAEPPPEEDEPSPTSEAPAWLQGLSAAFSAGIEAGQEGEDEIPVWLAELDAALPAGQDPDAPAETQPSGVEGAGEPSDVPSTPEDGLSPRTDAAVEGAAPAAAPEEEDRDVPAWLQRLLQDVGAPEAEAGAAPDAEPAEGAGFDWLGVRLPQQAVPSGSFFPPGSPEAEPQPVADAEPAWLAELQAGSGPGSERTGEEEDPEASATPIWPEGLEPEEEAIRLSAELLAGLETEPGIADEAATAAGTEETEPQDGSASPPPTPLPAPGAEPEPAEEAWADYEGEPEREPARFPRRPAPMAILGAESELAEAEWLGWMEDLEPEEVSHTLPVAPEGEPGLAEDETLDWVRDLRRGEMAPMPSAALRGASEAEPESARKEDAEAGQPAAPLPGVAPESLSEEPVGATEWPEEVLPTAQALGRGADLPGGQPSWLSDAEDDLDLEDHWLMQTVPEPLEEIPAWVAALRPGAEATEEPEEPAAEGMPDWLLTWTEDLLAGGEEELALADIPEWLWALRPQTPLEVQRMPGADRVETRGLLAGRKGVLPVEPIIALPPSGVRRPASSAPEDRSRADLFRRIATQPPLFRPLMAGRPGPGAVPAVVRWLISALLLAAVIVPLVFETDLFARSAAAPAPVQALYDAVAALEPDAPVLLIFDYTPTHDGEMDLIAEAVINHLVDRRARIVALSLSPTGPQLAQHVLDQVASGRSNYTYCQDYVNLGYVSGQVVALRSLVQSLWEGIPYDHLHACTGAQGELLPASALPVAAGVDDIGDFALIVDLASQQASVRWWIEQVGSQVEGLRLVAGVGAAAEPFIRPYADVTPPQVAGYVAGWPQVSDYLALQGRSQWALEGRLDAQIVGHGAMILILLAGNVAYVLQWGSRRGR